MYNSNVYNNILLQFQPSLKIKNRLIVPCPKVRKSYFYTTGIGSCFKLHKKHAEKHGLLRYCQITAKFAA